MSDVLKLAVIALDIELADPEENLSRVENLMREIPTSPDVVVLPELFTTGFIQDETLLAQVAERVDGTAMQALKRLSRQYDTAICGSMAVEDGGKLFNRAFFIEPDGKSTFYDKRHLFCLSSEATMFAQGRRPMPVVTFRGWRIALMVCYDLRFPVWSRNGKTPYDMLLVPSNWPNAREYAWTHLLIARAIENQAVVVGANRSGSDDYGTYDHLTFVYDAMGQPIGHPLDDCPIVLAAPSLENIAKIRRRLPVAASADSFTIDF
ncbi:MAG: nitrilase family protein [Muribaculaceae bacterium]|nr:nitrilase family protein [Muribaculaceae bacterium]